jgi:hypothetical protein
LSYSQQQDFITLHSGDTIHGKYIKRNSINKNIHIRTSTGKLKIPTIGVKDIYWKKQKYSVYEDPCEGGLSAYRVLVEGTVSFLNNDGYEDYCPQLFIINNEVFPLERKHYFSEEAWILLSKCPDFEEKYKAYYSERRKKIIVWEWVYRKSRTKWLEMIKYYNLNCGKTEQ